VLNECYLWLGDKVGSSVTKNADYLIAGEKADMPHAEYKKQTALSV